MFIKMLINLLNKAVYRLCICICPILVAAPDRSDVLSLIMSSVHRQSGRKLEPGVLYLSRALDLQLDTLIRQPDISPVRLCLHVPHTMGSWLTLSNYHTGIKKGGTEKIYITPS